MTPVHSSNNHIVFIRFFGILLSFLLTGCGIKAPPQPGEPIHPTPIIRSEKNSSRGVLLKVELPSNVMSTCKKIRLVRAEMKDGQWQLGEVVHEIETKDLIEDKKKRSVIWQYLDNGLTSKTSYRYWAVALDAEGTRFSPGPQIVIHWPNIPKTPEGITGVASNQLVTLTWDNPESAVRGDGSSIVGVNIYRHSVGEAYPSIPLQFIPFSEEKFTDGTVINGRIYYYRLATVVSWNGTRVEGALSRELVLFPKDDVAPFPPEKPTVLIEGKTVKLNWKANTEGDILGYHVYRQKLPEGPWIRLTTVPTAETQFEDSIDLKKAQYGYALTAVDNSPLMNESRRSEEVIVP